MMSDRNYQIIRAFIQQFFDFYNNYYLYCSIKIIKIQELGVFTRY